MFHLYNHMGARNKGLFTMLTLQRRLSSRGGRVKRGGRVIWWSSYRGG